jgi:hypothetical protein
MKISDAYHLGMGATQIIANIKAHVDFYHDQMESCDIDQYDIMVEDLIGIVLRHHKFIESSCEDLRQSRVYCDVITDRLRMLSLDKIQGLTG